MADNRKEQEREELHRTIWNIANDLRGSVDGWDFKQYVLGMLFYRYISENFSDYVNQGEREAGAAVFRLCRPARHRRRAGPGGPDRHQGLFHPAQPVVCQPPQAGSSGRKPE